MNPLLRVVHSLAVSLWFGAAVFFTAAGVLLFGAFRDASAPPAAERPAWLPLADLYAGASPGEGFPEPLRLEQGSRAAGAAVGRLFGVYYGGQAACGAAALLTALALARSWEGAAHRARCLLAAAALATALGGWWLEGEVARLRVPRNDLTDAALRAPGEAALAEARAARAAFGRWHGYSLVQNFVTLLLAGGLAALAPSLGGRRGGFAAAS